MVFHMKTTLIIPDPVFKDLKRRAIERGETLSALVTEYLRQGLRERAEPTHLPPLPSFDMGGPPLVNVADRDELYRVLDADRDARLYGIKKED